ncbi:VOC family protein [Streptomyces sp. NPDC102437]|uniref:VOC family protein n=1 Tax=Streptomyces sp. NPDC102437 TaxID=3366175 RepID=UPI0037F6000A
MEPIPTMPVHRLNHTVLFVSDVARSTAVYCDVLGFRALPQAFPGAAFLQAADSANDHDLGLFQSRDTAPGGHGAGAVGLYHLAWEVDTLAELRRVQARLTEAGALTGPDRTCLSRGTGTACTRAGGERPCTRAGHESP